MYNKSQSLGIGSDTISDYFYAKVKAIRDSTAHAPPPEFMKLSKVTLEVFEECTIYELLSFIRIAPAKLCVLYIPPLFSINLAIRQPADSLSVGFQYLFVQRLTYCLPQIYNCHSYC